MTLHSNLHQHVATYDRWLSFWYAVGDCHIFMSGLCSLLLWGFLCHHNWIRSLHHLGWLSSIMISAIVLFAIAPMLCLMFAHVMDSVLCLEVSKCVCCIGIWPYKCLKVKGSFRVVFPKEFSEFFEEACWIVCHDCREEAQLRLRLQWALADSGLDEGLHEVLYPLGSFWLVLEHH